MNPNLIWLYSYKKRKFGHKKRPTCTKERPWGDTRRWPFASQGKRTQKKQNLNEEALVLDFQSPILWDNKILLLKPSSLWNFVMPNEYREQRGPALGSFLWFLYLLPPGKSPPLSPSSSSQLAFSLLQGPPPMRWMQTDTKAMNTEQCSHYEISSSPDSSPGMTGLWSGLRPQKQLSSGKEAVMDLQLTYTKKCTWENN